MAAAAADMTPTSAAPLASLRLPGALAAVPQRAGRPAARSQLASVQQAVAERERGDKLRFCIVARTVLMAWWGVVLVCRADRSRRLRAFRARKRARDEAAQPGRAFGAWRAHVQQAQRGARRQRALDLAREAAWGMAQNRARAALMHARLPEALVAALSTADR